MGKGIWEGTFNSSAFLPSTCSVTADARPKEELPASLLGWSGGQECEEGRGCGDSQLALSFLGCTRFHGPAPFTRCLTHLPLSPGLVTSEKVSADHILSRKGGGNLLAIIVGGAQEALDARPGAYKLLLRNRKGFVRLALIHGYGALGITLWVSWRFEFCWGDSKDDCSFYFGKGILRPYDENCKLVSHSQVSRYVSIKKTGGSSGHT